MLDVPHKHFKRLPALQGLSSDEEGARRRLEQLAEDGKARVEASQARGRCSVLRCTRSAAVLNCRMRQSSHA